jgi:hypothetical protein
MGSPLTGVIRDKYRRIRRESEIPNLFRKADPLPSLRIQDSATPLGITATGFDSPNSRKPSASTSEHACRQEAERRLPFSNSASAHFSKQPWGETTEDAECLIRNKRVTRETPVHKPCWWIISYLPDALHRAAHSIEGLKEKNPGPLKGKERMVREAIPQLLDIFPRHSPSSKHQILKSFPRRYCSPA